MAGQWAYLYWAVEKHGQVIDVLLSVRRDLAAARRFFTRALRDCGCPWEPLVATVRDRSPPRLASRRGHGTSGS